MRLKPLSILVVVGVVGVAAPVHAGFYQATARHTDGLNALPPT
jgi:hypothetical protein